MAVNKAKKSEILASLEQELKAANSIAFTTNTKLTVLDVTNMRKELRTVDASFTLAKKTLIKIAFKNVYGVELSPELLVGQVAVLISKGDKIAGIAIVNKYAVDFRKEEKLKFVGGYFDGNLLNAAETAKIANLPSREVLLSKLFGSMKSPISALARFFDGAKKDIESKGLTKVSDLIDSAPKKADVKEIPHPNPLPEVEGIEKTEDVKEEVSEVATEEVVETPAVEEVATEVTPEVEA
ncbi:50S ribosomal protein L10 [Candidatus Gracilibacteria bacterium]|nr:50S ribosomal protein L10 [Candidatus Gracilibacteria bacterium]